MTSTAFILLVSVLPGAVRQSPPLRIADGSAVHEIAPVAEDGVSFFPTTALEQLRAEIRTDPSGATVLLFGDTLVFQTLSPFFTVDGEVVQLAFPIRSSVGSVLIPEQFFIEWLPTRYPERVQYRSGVLHVTNLSAPNRAPSSAVDSTSLRPPQPRAERVVPVVILDAGHGGPDLGTVSRTGLREKDATLAIARRTAPLLRERGYEVHLTRTGDTLIALADRPRMANRWKGNRPALFISIHANSIRSSRIRGFETFFLSDARTDDERRVAEMENAAAEFEDRTAANDDVVGDILNDIRNDFYVRASADLAETVQNRLANFHTGENRGVKRAGFRVLVGALMPAVLVEVGFMSNASEARLLGSAAFQDRLARSLADAVERFFARSEHLWTRGR